MLKGEMSIGFVMRTAIGFVLIAGMAYAVLSMEDSLRKQQQEQAITDTARYVASEILWSMEDLGEGETINKTIWLPSFREATASPYGVTIENKVGEIYVKAYSTQWQLISRQPLHLNSSEVELNAITSFPPKICVIISRTDNYQINVTC
jgi:hypothetical protein